MFCWQFYSVNQMNKDSRFAYSLYLLLFIRQINCFWDNVVRAIYFFCELQNFQFISVFCLWYIVLSSWCLVFLNCWYYCIVFFFNFKYMLWLVLLLNIIDNNFFPSFIVTVQNVIFCFIYHNPVFDQSILGKHIER